MTRQDHINRLKVIKGYCCAQKDQESLDYAIKAIEKEIEDESDQCSGLWSDDRKAKEAAGGQQMRIEPEDPEVRAMLAKLEAAPEIPLDKRGVKYTSTCTCGGTITAIRSPYNGHYQASCDGCGWRMRE